ncbi:uncharacterized protein LOC113227549 [Hyposmocoma kahamanoa]|uniref:uncharacterized protein LOC113227549 n=1 Tax=Hyposmocoma kahamanoa TaxID=1477025 RepID=UPI000E6D944D|nr:uncharacterized protein LOC113227549 [Hyposmocoma kahamanoa]
MLSYIDNKTYKRVNIEITTFKRNIFAKDQRTMTDGVMCRNRNSQTNRNHNSRFICSICLNTNSPKEDRDDLDPRRKTKSCPVCQRNLETCIEKCTPKKDSSSINCKTVQTSLTDISEGFNLLNEVLTVFQTQKVDCKKLVKDAAVLTEHKKPSNVNLEISKIFSFSVRCEDRFKDDSKFSVIDCHQPYVSGKSHINLSKHKSSSIPQMKMEELKKSLTEKIKSKDAVEEVNRMFATVRKNYHEMSESNRPLVRSGPRVLPVVKTGVSNNLIKMEKSEGNIPSQEKKLKNFQCCQTSNYYLSGGDSVQRFSIVNDNQRENDNKNVYRCEYPQIQKRPEIFVCNCCGNKSEVKNSYTSFV